MTSNPNDIINQPSPSDALAILKVLASNEPHLAKHIAESALNYLGQVDPQKEAEVLFTELDLLEVEEVWDRAGETRHGYVDSGEAAYQMVEEVFEPYREQLKKYQRLGLMTQANRLTMGLVWGLYRFEHEATSEFKNWAPGVAGSYAQEVVELWLSGSPGSDDRASVIAFIEDELGGWGGQWLQ